MKLEISILDNKCRAGRLGWNGLTQRGGRRLCKIAALYVLKLRYRKRIEAEQPVSYGRRSAARKAERIIGILALTGMLAYSCMMGTWGPLLAAAVMCIILYGVDFLLGRMRPSRKENWVLQITGGIGSVYVMLVLAAVLLSVPVENHETSGVPDLSHGEDLSEQETVDAIRQKLKLG